MGDRPDDTPTKPERGSAEEREQDRELVTGGKPLVDDDVLEQPTDDVDHDEGAGKHDPTPNPAKIAP
ncbi:hypothetical protein BH23ACT9_BH23ACT9_26620 [soil metagenome]